MHHHQHQQPQDVDYDMAFAAIDLLMHIGSAFFAAFGRFNVSGY
jgi:hypothetical protein